MAHADDRLFYVCSRLCGLVLDIAENNMDPGAKLWTWTKIEHGDPRPNQLWYEDHATGTIRTFSNHFCMDVDGETIVVNPLEPGKADQRWMLAGDRIQNCDDPQRVVDITGCCCDRGTELCVFECNGQKNQKWFFEYLPVRYFKILSSLSGNALDLDHGNTDAGAHVHMWGDNGADNQTWYQGRDGLIRAKLNGFVLDGSGETVVLNAFDPGNQMQGFTISDNKIVNMNEPEKVLDIKDQNQDTGASLCVWDYNGQDNQHWIIEYV